MKAANGGFSLSILSSFGRPSVRPIVRTHFESFLVVVNRRFGHMFPLPGRGGGQLVLPHPMFVCVAVSSPARRHEGHDLGLGENGGLSSALLV